MSEITDKFKSFQTWTKNISLDKSWTLPKWWQLDWAWRDEILQSKVVNKKWDTFLNRMASWAIWGSFETAATVAAWEQTISDLPIDTAKGAFNLLPDNVKSILSSFLPESFTDWAPREWFLEKTERIEWIKKDLISTLWADPEATSTKVGEFLWVETFVPWAIWYKAVSNAIKFKGSSKFLEPKIVEDFTKAIKPSTKFWTSKNYKNNVIEAVTNITLNKDKLKLTDQFWDVVKNTLPENVNQFSSSIDTLKKDFYSQYTKIATDAWKNTTADLSPVIKELELLKTNRSFLDNADDWTINYVDSLIKRYSEEWAQREILTLQDTKQWVNNRLQTFFNNPDPNSYWKSLIDWLVNNQMWKVLDDTITNASWLWNTYNDLKKSYWSLSSIQKDVMNRAFIEARKSSKWLIDYTDIFSVWDIAWALVSWSSWGLTRWTTQLALKELFKFLNNPDRIIKNMFKSSEKNLSNLIK